MAESVRRNEQQMQRDARIAYMVGVVNIIIRDGLPLEDLRVSPMAGWLEFTLKPRGIPRKHGVVYRLQITEQTGFTESSFQWKQEGEEEA